MTEHDVLHTRLDNLEEKIGKMADAVSKMADTISDIKVINERGNQHAALIKEQDKRLDEIEKKIPIYDLFVSSLKKIGVTVGTVIVLAILGLIIA